VESAKTYERLEYLGIRVVAVSQGIDTESEQADWLTPSASVNVSSARSRNGCSTQADSVSSELARIREFVSERLRNIRELLVADVEGAKLELAKHVTEIRMIRKCLGKRALRSYWQVEPLGRVCEGRGRGSDQCRKARSDGCGGLQRSERAFSAVPPRTLQGGQPALIEHSPEKAGGGGSIPSLATCFQALTTPRN